MADPKDLAAQLSAFNAIEAEQPWYKKQLPIKGRATFLPFRDTMEGSVFNKRELALPGLLAGAVNAFTAPERARTNTDPTFNAGEEAANFALNTFGGGIATGKALRNPTGQGGVDLSMNAWHGSPHNIEGNFDLAKVGTGEGAQAKGYGMYYGEARGTGEQYKKTLKHKGFNFANEETALGIELPASARGQFMQLAQRYPDDPMQAAGWVQSGNIAAREIPKEKIAELFKAYKEKTQGFLYKVDIPDEQIPLMLNWDETLNKQPQAVKDAFSKLGITVDEKANKAFLNDLEAQLTGGAVKGVKEVPNPTGESLYNKLVSKFGSPEAASRELNKLGVSGIRYLDEGSRMPSKYTGDSAYTNAGQSFKESGFTIEDALLGMKKAYKNADETELKQALSVVYGEMPNRTSNFVVFKPETVKILEKNDVPVTRKELLQQEFDKLKK
jgi:hypothetical protein